MPRLHHKFLNTKFLLVAAFLFALILIIANGAALYSSFTSQLQNPRRQGQPQLSRQIAKVTIVYPSPDSVSYRALALHDAQNERFNYAMHILRRPLVRGAVNLLYHLQKIIMDELSKDVVERVKWILYFDSNLLLSSPSTSLSAFFPTEDLEIPYSSFAALTLIGIKPDNHNLTSTIFLIRVQPLSLRLLTLAIAAIHNDPIVTANGEQDIPGAALQYILEKQEWRDKVIYQPRKWWLSESGDDKTSSNAIFKQVKAENEALQLIKMDEMMDVLEAEGMREKAFESDMRAALEVEVQEYWRTLGEARSVLDKAGEMRDDVERQGLERQVGELKDWMELFAWDVEGVKKRIREVKTALGIGDVLDYDAVV